MNICGVLVNCLAGKTQEVSEALSALPGVEVHITKEDTNQLVVTAEDTEETFADQQVLEIHRTPGVVSAGLTYHQFEPNTDPDLKAA
ncbi:assembly protein for periplasmic nitrate reductase [Pseudovibrio sp. W64]|uniref:chaperone NapD n=1 Tax=unclassified Pseudovibrio TaxID=2627060 RepID=UPI0007AEB600|nr:MULTISPECIES: chaperone NapD [unclassified Pseudovibrio]KZK80666.1 assembly protein for periplasmic nitrate reductase [Pseudovibrio sp. Ad13]KZK86742.1 assembly protein for periplasmic nitrate reductase [Pseudovibrio sp. W64]